MMWCLCRMVRSRPFSATHLRKQPIGVGARMRRSQALFPVHLSVPKTGRAAPARLPCLQFKAPHALRSALEWRNPAVAGNCRIKIDQPLDGVRPLGGDAGNDQSAIGMTDGYHFRQLSPANGIDDVFHMQVSIEIRSGQVASPAETGACRGVSPVSKVTPPVFQIKPAPASMACALNEQDGAHRPISLQRATEAAPPGAVLFLFEVPGSSMARNSGGFTAVQGEVQL